MRRRQALALVTGSLSFVAGCSSESTPDSAPTTSKTSTTTIQEPQMRELPMTAPSDRINCDADANPVSIADDDSYPERANGFELTASKDVVTMGEKITFALTNVGGAQQSTGEKFKYNILRQSDGWEPVYYTKGPAGYTDLGLYVSPGGGFQWPFTVTSKGLERQNDHNPTYYVCSPLEPSEYRFAFFGLGDNTVATRFTVKEP